MPSSKAYRDFVLEQLRDLHEIRDRPMMGEYILYYKDRIFGGIYDDRLLIKPVPAARALLPDAAEELPYETGSAMLLMDEVDDAELLCRLVEAMYPELPEPKKRGAFRRA